MRSLSRARSIQKLLDFGAIVAGFGVAILLWKGLPGGEWIPPADLLGGFALSVLIFSLAVELRNNTVAEDTGMALFQQFCFGTGLNLVLHALLAYLSVLNSALFLIVAGGLLATILRMLARRWIFRPFVQLHSGVLLVGFDSITDQFLGSLRLPVIGIIDQLPQVVPAGVPFLGDFRQLQQILADCAPTHMIVSTPDWASRISPSVLLDCRLAGMVIEDSVAVYDRLLLRVCCRRMQPMDLLLSRALRADSRAMAIQAIYTNLVGLFFLLALLPLLLVVGAAVALFSGPGPTLESIECTGFQKIPFRLFRFRTRRLDGSGAPTRIGRMISKLQLVNLPQLINIVRGEMALFGPRPVREKFARRLTECMPFYSYRFSVKPGVLGWAQVHVQDRISPPEESTQIEYDLHYIKAGAPILDLEILIRTLLGALGTRRRNRRANQSSQATRH